MNFPAKGSTPPLSQPVTRDCHVCCPFTIYEVGDPSRPHKIGCLIRDFDCVARCLVANPGGESLEEPENLRRVREYRLFQRRRGRWGYPPGSYVPGGPNDPNFRLALK